MGLLYEYFCAPSDQKAATALDHRPDRSAFDVVDLPDIDPTTVLAVVEQLLTGRDEDDIAEGGICQDFLDTELSVVL
ncbi:MAG TPA: hypothetical protein VFM55_25085 [Micromonosporaceae bacterium]|nr:hypothetical protein [Micromonosporaceae bacterium]